MTPPANEEVVFALSRASRCHGCDTKLEKGEIVKLSRHEDEKRLSVKSVPGLWALTWCPVATPRSPVWPKSIPAHTSL